MRLVAPLLGLALLAGGDPPALRVRAGDAWLEWWRADAAPTRWSAPLPEVAGAVRWRAAAPGVEWGELEVSGDGEAWRLKVVLVRLDPRQVRIRTDVARRPDGSTGRWTVADAPAAALVAFNAGQFDHDGAWGWLVREGTERHEPGRGPLAPALVVDTAGAVRIVPPDSLAAVRGRGEAREAFQSYPTLLDAAGTVPRPLAEAGLGVDHEHRDGRLAIGLLRDGRMLVALTRFAGLGEALSRIPFGLTTPEMAALMGALGCERAVLLDGGASGQLLVRDGGRTRTWPGSRRVPVGLVALPR